MVWVDDHLIYYRFVHPNIVSNLQLLTHPRRPAEIKGARYFGAQPQRPEPQDLEEQEKPRRWTRLYNPYHPCMMYIYLYLPYKNHQNVGKYIIHWMVFSSISLHHGFFSILTDDKPSYILFPEFGFICFPPEPFGQEEFLPVWFELQRCDSNSVTGRRLITLRVGSSTP